jgi:ABC-type antimicrobial peptide transport system permease subunit
MEKNIHISYGETPKETVDLCRKFFKNLFYLILSDLHKYNILYKVGVNIYLSGGITTIPLIDIFLEQSFDRNFIIHDVIQKFSSIYNRNIFSNLIATSEYISKKREFDLLLKIASSG